MAARIAAWDKAEPPEVLDEPAFRRWQTQFAQHRQHITAVKEDRNPRICLPRYEDEVDYFRKITANHQKTFEHKREQAAEHLRKGNARLVQKLCEVARDSDRRQVKIGEYRESPEATSLNEPLRRRQKMTIDAENRAMLRRLEGARAMVPSAVQSARSYNQHHNLTKNMSRIRRPAREVTTPRKPQSARAPRRTSPHSTGLLRMPPGEARERRTPSRLGDGSKARDKAATSNTWRDNAGSPNTYVASEGTAEMLRTAVSVFSQEPSQDAAQATSSRASTPADTFEDTSPSEAASEEKERKPSEDEVAQKPIAEPEVERKLSEEESAREAAAEDVQRKREEVAASKAAEAEAERKRLDGETAKKADATEAKQQCMEEETAEKAAAVADALSPAPSRRSGDDATDKSEKSDEDDGAHDYEDETPEASEKSEKSDAEAGSEEEFDAESSAEDEDEFEDETDEEEDD